MHPLSYKYFGVDFMQRFSAVIFVLFFYCLVFQDEISLFVKEALLICSGVVLPSLYVFIVLSKIMSKLIKQPKKTSTFSKFISSCLGISPILLPVGILGLIGSAPSMSYAVGNMYKDGRITKDEAERIACISNNCSISFILGVVSGIFGDKKVAIIIFLSNMLSVIIVYRLFFAMKHVQNTKSTAVCEIKEGFCEIVCDSISSSASDSLTLCSYIVFFYTAARCICSLSFLSAKPLMRAFIFGFFEMTGGVNSLNYIEGYGKILLACTFLSFCGLSVIFQVKSALSRFGLSSKKFIKAKILSAFLSPVICVILLFFVPVDRPCFSVFEYGIDSKILYFNAPVVANIFCILFIFFYIFGKVAKKHKKGSLK